MPLFFLVVQDDVANAEKSAALQATSVQKMAERVAELRQELTAAKMGLLASPSLKVVK